MSRKKSNGDVFRKVIYFEMLLGKTLIYYHFYNETQNVLGDNT